MTSNQPGHMTDQQIAAYATQTQPIPLSPAQRKYCASQMKPPFVFNSRMSDKALAGAVIASWATAASKSVEARAAIRSDLKNEYWHGDPETNCRDSFAKTFLAAIVVGLFVAGLAAALAACLL